MQALRVGIVGGGTGGPAAALFLSRAGHQVTLFERVENPGPVGAGLLLQPTGLGVLQDLGLRQGAVSAGARVTRLDGRTPGGRPVLALSYKALGPDMYGVGIHRGVLFDLLIDAVRNSDVQFVTGAEVTGFSDDALQLADRSQQGPFDLVVVADGARSTLRSQLPMRHRVDQYPWGALWAVLEDPDQLFKESLFQVYGDTRRMVGFLPTGQSPSGGPPLVSLFWSLRVGAEDALLADGVDAFKQSVRVLAPQSEPLLGQIQGPQDLVMARYWDVRMACFHTDRIVVIGDAAHATSPQLGQGANLALVDAWILSRCVGEQATIAQALQAYEKQRRPHLRYYQWASRWLTPVFQSSLVPVGWGRDLLMGPICRAPFFRDLMLTTLVGVSTGPFSTLRDSPVALLTGQPS
jgi:2-polyprenyl-6-methoxyphenol hydroxylase-like FAD-dependent oxidoreductase